MAKELKKLAWYKDGNDAYVLQIAKSNAIQASDEIFARITAHHDQKNRLLVQVMQCFGKAPKSDWFYLIDFKQAQEFAEQEIIDRANDFIELNYEEVTEHIDAE